MDKKTAIALAVGIVAGHFSGQFATAQTPYIRQYPGVTVAKAKASYAEAYEDQIMSRVKDKTARRDIGVLFGAFYHACQRLSTAENHKRTTEQIEKEILQDAIVSLTTDWTKESQ